MNKRFFEEAGGPIPVPVAFADGRVPDLRARPASSLLVQYLNVLLKRKWLLLGVTVSMVVAGLVVTLLMTPLYTASATLEIKRENYAIVNVQGVEPERNSVDPEFYETQYGLLKARSVAERIVRELKLADNAGFFAMFGDTSFDADFADGTASRTSADSRARRAASILLSNMEISSKPFSRLVEISFTSPDPKFSADVVNAWSKSFIEATLARRFDATSYARRFLEQRLEQLRQRLEESERNAVAYAVRQELINIPSSTSSGEDGATTTERPLVADDLTALNRELAEATADRIRAESALRAAGGPSLQLEAGSAVPALRQRRSELASEYANLLSKFQPQYPPAMALAAQIDELDRSIAQEESRLQSGARGTLRETYQAAQTRESSLQQRVNALKGALMDLRSRTIQYNIFQRDVDTNRQLYDGLLQRYKEIGVAGGVGVNNIAVVDEAEAPGGPSSPNLLLNIALSLIVGAGLAGLLAFVLEQFDDVIADPNDVKEKLEVPVLGAIPKIARPDTVEELEDPKSAVSEAYLSVQAALALATDQGIPGAMVVTSARPAEGKSTSAVALAQILARSGKKVLLVDGDMRKPSIHEKLGIANDHGLSNVLSGADDWQSIVAKSAANGLHVLPSGPLPPNAAELISSPRLEQLLSEVARHYDHCIIDGPPVMGLADAPILCSRTDGAIFVVQAGSTRASASRIGLERLLDARVRVLGAVLTKFDAKRSAYGYGDVYEYGYGKKDELA